MMSTAESVQEMIRFARCYPGSVQRCRTEDGLRIDLKVADGYVYFNLSRTDRSPTEAEYMDALPGKDDGDAPTPLRVEIEARKCLLTVWSDENLP